MKKLLSILGVVSLTATGTSGIVSCKNPEQTNKQPPKEQTTVVETKPTPKATDQQFADEIAKIINKKKYIFILNDLSKDRDQIIKTLKGFIKEIKIDKFDTSEFDKTKITFENISIFYTSTENELNDIIIKYNNVKSNTKINLEFR